MKSETIEPAEERTFDRIAREQFDAFENQERLLSEDERTTRAARLNLPIQISMGLSETALADSARAVDSFSLARQSDLSC
jgi:hypothetical protein